MDYTFVIPIGDASEDGHGICDRFLIKSNKSLTEVEQAYKDSCELTGLQMNTNSDYTGLGLSWSELDKRKMINEYEDSKLSDFHKHILLEKGVRPDFLEIDGSSDFLDFFFEFIRLTLKDMEFEIMSEEKPEFKWNIGYGLFID